jgi:hypothetical protein
LHLFSLFACRTSLSAMINWYIAGKHNHWSVVLWKRTKFCLHMRLEILLRSATYPLAFHSCRLINFMSDVCRSQMDDKLRR